LTIIYDAPAEGNFCDNNGKTIKPQTVVDYMCHMGYAEREIEWLILTLSTN